MMETETKIVIFQCNQKHNLKKEDLFPRVHFYSIAIPISSQHSSTSGKKENIMQIDNFSISKWQQVKSGAYYGPSQTPFFYKAFFKPRVILKTFTLSPPLCFHFPVLHYPSQQSTLSCFCFVLFFFLCFFFFYQSNRK